LACLLEANEWDSLDEFGVIVAGRGHAELSNLKESVTWSHGTSFIHLPSLKHTNYWTSLEWLLWNNPQS